MLFCIGIGGIFLLTSCGETIDVVQPDTTAPVIITAQVLPMQSIGNHAATRAMTAAEKVINKAYVVQFNGTAPTSTAVWVSPDVSAQLKNGDFIKCDFTLSGTRSRVYVIANPKTTPTVNMTLAAFETVAYSVSASLPATGLPLAASQDVSAGDAFHLFQLKCPLAKLTFSTNTGSLSLRGIPSAYSLVPATPGSSPVRPSGITYTATATLASGTAYYVPANLSGTVNLSNHTLRYRLFAPANSMYVVNTANGFNYTTYLGSGTASDFNVVSNCAYTVTTTTYLSDGSDLRVELFSIELDINGTANCYIVTGSNTTCSFSATVMGNGRTTPAHTAGSAGGGNYPAIIPTTLTPTSAVVLWETFNTTTAPTTVGSVVSDVALVNGRVTFRAGTVPGNAVIAVKNSSGVILWSWHIWRLNESPKEIGLNAIGSLTIDNELVLMDRNLGALSAVAGNDLSIGLHYQWGRKDPMPGYGALDGGAMATQPSGIPGTAAGGSSVTPSTAVANPTTFYTGSNWTTRTDNLWGTPLTETVSIAGSSFNSNPGMKSIYDPCPVGWRVPPGYAFANATVANGGTWNRGFSFAIANMSSYFPASGNRYYSNGKLFNLGAIGYCWTSSPNAVNGSSLYFSSSYVYQADSSVRAYGYSCRCVKE